jgi:hypothetical protein
LDLSQLDTGAAAEGGVDMALKHPVTNAPLLQDDGETPITIRLLGMDSKAFRKATRANQDRRLRGTRYRAPTAEELDAEGLELLVKCTISWTGIVLDGSSLDCTPVNVRTLFTRLPWVREQIDNYIGDRANFLAPSPTN